MFLPALIVILAFSAMLYLRFNKGKIAEKMVHHKLMQLPEEYHVIDDVLFMSNGRSTQIDHIVVSPYAVFVIETKGYKGWILGGENSEYWTQIIYKRKSTFYNPIHQNDGHIRFLKFLLKDLGNIPFVPIVVFNNEADLKVNVNNHIVVNRYYLKDTFLQYKETVISQELKTKSSAVLKRAVGHKRKELYVNTSTTQKASDVTPEIRFNMVYAQDAEVCLLNDVENMGVCMDAQTTPNVHSP